MMLARLKGRLCHCPGDDAGVRGRSRGGRRSASPTFEASLINTFGARWGYEAKPLGVGFLFKLESFRGVPRPQPRRETAPRKLSALLDEPEGTKVWVRPDALFTTRGEGAAV